MKKEQKKKGLTLSKKKIVSLSAQVKGGGPVNGSGNAKSITITLIPCCNLSFMVSCIDAW